MAAGTIGAIDAGTNAVRLVIARAKGPDDYARVYQERWPVRLGHQVYTRQRFGQETLSRAVEVFEHFRDLFRRFGVDRYRAVATSATREAVNRDTLLERVEQEARIRLDVISGDEEARLTRVAVEDALLGKPHPQLILDIGGGSLEIIRLDDRGIIDSASFPIGTVRLMEAFGIDGPIEPDERAMLRRYVLTLLREYYGPEGIPAAEVAVGCGGNVGALAKIARGPKRHGIATLHFDRLAERADDIFARGVEERMAAYSVRRDRAEVMGVAAVVLGTAAEFLGVRALLAPDVGVREGVLLELAQHAVA